MYFKCIFQIRSFLLYYIYSVEQKTQLFVTQEQDFI